MADDEIAIAIVGRLVPIKSHDLFLEAMAAVARRTQLRVRAFIVGDGEERDHLEARVKELGLSHAVAPIFNGHGFGHGAGSGAVVPQATITFTSWIKEVDIVYAGVDLVVLTSLNEGTPVSPIEAQAIVSQRLRQSSSSRALSVARAKRRSRWRAQWASKQRSPKPSPKFQRPQTLLGCYS